MSRVGRSPITLPAGVTVLVNNDLINVTGPKGTLEKKILPEVTIKTENNVLTVSRHNDLPLSRARHGLMRALINNMIVGVSQGFDKKLEINGVGFRASIAGSDLKMNLGFSHEVNYKLPEGIQASIEQNVITVAGIDKQKVGQAAAEIRALKKPEPYKGKGIKYIDERIIRKSGKSGKEK